MSWSNVLENYAKLKDPRKELPSGVFLMQDDHTVTIFDGYEKAKYHFLVMVPRYPFPLPSSSSSSSSKSLSLSDLSSLHHLLKTPHALDVLKALEKAGEKVKMMIEDEMIKNEGWKWPIQIGFHASESMKHVHLHVISSDLISPKLKNKKHYNSFHPKLGFFLHLSSIIQDLTDGNLPTRSPSSYEQILKDPLISIYDEKEYGNIPKLKIHLEERWEEMGRRTKMEMEVERKRKKEEEGEGEGGEKKEKKKKT